MFSVSVERSPLSLLASGVVRIYARGRFERQKCEDRDVESSSTLISTLVVVVLVIVVVLVVVEVVEVVVVVAAAVTGVMRS